MAKLSDWIGAGIALAALIFAGCESQGSILLKQADEATRGGDYDRALFNIQDFLKRYPNSPDTSKARQIQQVAGVAKRDEAAEQIKEDIKADRIPDARVHLDEVRELVFLPGNDEVVFNLDSVLALVQEQMRDVERDRIAVQREMDSLRKGMGNIPIPPTPPAPQALPVMTNIDSLVNSAMKAAGMAAPKAKLNK